MIALSTWWKSTELDRGRELLAQIRDLGFNSIELDCHLTGAAIGEMKPLLGTEFQVVSVHNFCPIPRILPKGISGSDVFSLSSPDKEERERAVEYTIQTIELADSVDSRIVVCHFGYVDIKDPTERLIELYNKGEKESDDFTSLLESAQDNRATEQQ